MIFKDINGDLFSSKYNKVQCISADFKMGAGIALKFNEKYNMRNILINNYGIDKAEDTFQKTGGFCIYRNGVYNLVTKHHYWEKPSYESFRAALEDMSNIIDFQSIPEEGKERKTVQLAMPEIGCGLDGLELYKVKEIIKDVFQDLPVEIEMYHFNKEKEQYGKANPEKNEKVFRLLIAGSRTFDAEFDGPKMEIVLKKLLNRKINDGYTIEIVEGEAKGADTWAKEFAKNNHLKIVPFPADWQTYGKSAGIIRNNEMYQYIHQAECAAFLLWDGESHGTKHDIELSDKYHIQTTIFDFKRNRWSQMNVPAQACEIEDVEREA